MLFMIDCSSGSDARFRNLSVKGTKVSAMTWIAGCVPILESDFLRSNERKFDECWVI